MAAIETIVQEFYGRSGVLDGLLAALANNGIDPSKPAVADLFPYDQLHGRGLAATKEHADIAEIRPRMRVLDLGCGIGGASRYLAAMRGCRVTGIDLTREFVDAADVLTRLCGLGDTIDYHQASALHLPFEDGAFDHVWSQNVGMNISDKRALAEEVARVLRTGGRYSFSELTLGSAGEPPYPLPWARNRTASFLVTPEDTLTTLQAAGFRIVKEVNLTQLHATHVREMVERLQRSGHPGTANDVVMGEQVLLAIRNSYASQMDGRLVERLFIAEKASPGSL
jgi:SAM-dependent methyltransferase